MASKSNKNRNLSDFQRPIHPGQFVRDTALTPKKMTVTAAAKLIGVSRPSASNFLNGKVGATTDMAARIERAFNIPAQKLLDLQAAYDVGSGVQAPANTRTYVPPFLQVKANDIEAWATKAISARTRFSVLLRTLVHSTGADLKRVNFPGNDDGERPGWDGYIEAGAGTPWIPQGGSGWEFGLTGDIKGKADGDFAKSVKATPKAERDESTFVFVTPRRWPGKDAWLLSMKSKKKWKDVRAYDSSDLEQWLEQSLPGQAWFANEIALPAEGVRSLDKCWQDWADVSSPPLVGKLFSTAVESSSRTISTQLNSEPNGPTVITADSVDEALAFLAQLFEQNDEALRHRDRVLVFDQPGILPKLAQGAQNFIAVAHSRDVERELGAVSRSLHTIVVYPRNATNADPHIVLEPLNHDAFREALEQMKFERDDIVDLAYKSGRSLTVLRRQLSNVPAVRTPEWVSDNAMAPSLIPFLFAGTWNSQNETDRTTLSLLGADAPYDDLEKKFQAAARLNDAPVWSIGNFRGVVSKIDLLFAISAEINIDDLVRFFEIAKIVLGEDDPSLDLPEDQRWAAELHGKSRDFSGPLREGISESLVLLAVHGNHLFKDRLGFDAEAAASQVVRDELLSPLTTRTLEAQERDLPTYAEAAPEEFLSIMEADLKQDNPAALTLMRPAASGVFGNCPRTGLLWALEGLAWNPDNLPRTALILARLAEVEIDDNWVNKPIQSLQGIFRSWMPQTAANHDERIAALKLIAKQFPNVAWKICIEQIDTRSRTGDYSHKPRWRGDGYGFGEPIKTWPPIIDFMKELTEIIFSWPEYSPKMLCDLVDRLHDLGEPGQDKVWSIIDTWVKNGAMDKDKAIVREKIRVTIMSRRGKRRSSSKDQPNLLAAGKAVYKSLEPANLLDKHAWLFREHWVEVSADEINDDELDFDAREKQIEALRTSAIREVLKAGGIELIFELAEQGNAATLVGWLLTKNVIEAEEAWETIKMALECPSKARESFVTGAMRALEEGEREATLSRLICELPSSKVVQILLLSPFRSATWQWVDSLEKNEQDEYWREVNPEWIHDSELEANESVRRLLEAKRPRAAFHCVHLKLSIIEPSLLFRLLDEMSKANDDKPGEYQVREYEIEKAFELLDKDTSLTLEQRAGLEFAYLDILADRWQGDKKRGIPNLERYIEAHPQFFVQAVVWTYRRKDSGQDPEEWRVPEDKVEALARRGHKLLEGLRRIPASTNSDELDGHALAEWTKAVREGCLEMGRVETGDLCIGKLFSTAPQGTDGVWPCEAVRQVLEDIQSEAIARGVRTGLYNERGVHWRGEGGDQERELADMYRGWANSLQYSHPFVASLLRGLVKTYESEASREDTEAGIRRRLH